MRVALLVAVALISVGVAYGQEKYEEKCTIATGNGVSVDSCDARKFLSCQSGYCRCNDPGTQLYDYRYAEQTSRTRRSPKKGSKGGSSKKGIGTGAVIGGAVGAYGGYQVGKAVANAGNGDSSTRYSSSSSSSSESRSKKKEYSCYGRVGSQCVLSYNNVNIVSLGTTTTTTTTAPATNATENETTTATSSNVTTTENTAESSTTAATPSASALTDISKIPKCVRNAVCQRPSVGPASNATATGTDRHVVQVDGDPRLGVCTCAPGYVASKTDQCIKAPSGASNLSLGFSVIVFALVSKLIN